MIQNLLKILILSLSITFITLDQVRATDKFKDYKIIFPKSKSHNITTYEDTQIGLTIIKIVSAIEKKLSQEKINISSMNIEIYLDEISNDNIRKIQNPKNNNNWQSISSPWIEIVKSKNNLEKSVMKLKIDMGYVRLMMDFFSYDNEAIASRSFRQIPYMDSTCLRRIEQAYVAYIMTDGYEFFRLADAFDCAPKVMRRPLLSLFESSPQTDLFPMTEFIYQTLDSCLSTASEYYTELYPRLALRGLQILKSESNYEPMWWVEIVEKTQPIQRCPKTLN